MSDQVRPRTVQEPPVASADAADHDGPDPDWLTSPLRPEGRRPDGGDRSVLSAVLEGSIDAIILLTPVRDGEGAVVDFGLAGVNSAMVAMAARPADAMVGHSMLELWDVPEVRRIVRRLARVLADGDPFSVEFSIPREDASLRWFHINCLRFIGSGDAGAPGVAVVCRDITVHRDHARLLADIRRQHEILQRQALSDPLTGLANRLLLDARLEHALRRLQRSALAVAIMFLDLDGLKDVNDRFGHHVGDLLLREVAGRLRRSARPYAPVARLGGDEFVVVCEDVTPADVPRIAHRLLEACAAPFDIADHRISISTSIGVTIADSPDDPTALISAADSAMYDAKQSGGNRIAYSAVGLGAFVDDRYDLERSLPIAIERGDLTLDFEPVVGGTDRRILGVDARVRWPHPIRGTLSTAMVRAIADTIHLTAGLERWTISETLRHAGRREQDGDTPIVFAVEIGSEVLCSDGFASWLRDELARHQVPPARFGLAIEHEAFVVPDGSVAHILDELHAIGVLIGRLDVGRTTEPGSYAQLHPLHYIRLAPELVDQLDQGGDLVIGAIADIARERGRMMVATHVETADQYATLRRMGVDLFQGSYVAAPISADELPHASLDVAHL